MKTLIFFGLILGSYIGGYLPVLWGDSVFSFTSVILSAVGAFIGIWAGYKLAIRFGLE